jgi:hypothetical protein
MMTMLPMEEIVIFNANPHGHHEASSEASVIPHPRQPHGRRPPQAPHQQNCRNEDDNHRQQPRNHNEDQEDARPLHRCNVHDEEEIFGKLKFTMPKFKGEDNPEAYLSWVRKVDKIFRIHNYSNAKKVAMTSLDFEDYASV